MADSLSFSALEYVAMDRNYMKRQKASPDALMQLAIQVKKICEKFSEIQKFFLLIYSRWRFIAKMYYHKNLEFFFALSDFCILSPKWDKSIELLFCSFRWHFIAKMHYHKNLEFFFALSDGILSPKWETDGDLRILQHRRV